MRQQHKTRAVAVMIRELQYGATSREMVEASGLHVNTIWRWMRALRAEGLVYIEGWERDARGCSLVPAYRWGNRKDAPQPPRKSGMQRMRDHRRRKSLRQIQDAMHLGGQ